MLQNYLKIAFRNLRKFKGYAAINIFGLAIGIACCLLIVQHLRDELSFDHHHTDLEQLYRVTTTFKTGDNETLTATTPSPLAWELAENYPEVAEAARIMKAPNTNQYLVKYEDQSFFELDGFLADSTFFRILRYDFVEGDPQKALNEPFNVVISKTMAEKMFANQNALGRTIKIGDQWGDFDFEITGVIDNDTYPTHIEANFFMNMRSGPVGQHFYALNEWAGNNLYHTYLKLQPNASAAGLEAKFPALVEEKVGDRLRMLGFNKEHSLEAVKDIYLHSEATYVTGPLGDITFVYIFAAIAAFILLIACINFMNLSTAKATIRAQEVGVRKVVGATRSMLSGQFLTEAFVYASLAVVVAYILSELALPMFNQMSGKELRLDLLQDGVIAIWMVGILIVTAMVAGSYPALYLSSFSPIKIFKGKIGDRFSAKQVRKVLVVVQFIVSIALIQGILVIQQQLDFLRQKKLGFEPAAKIVVPLNTREAVTKYPVVKEKFLTNADVHDVSATSAAPGSPNIEDMLVYGEGMSQDASIHTMRNWIDPGYLELMNFELVAGRGFDETRLADTVQSVVINERLMKYMGYSESNVIGKQLYWNWDGNQHSHQIIGVVKDFHASSLREEVDNHMFSWHPEQGLRQLVASVSTADLPQLVDQLNAEWTAVNPSEPFDYYFLNDKLQQAYLSDQRMAGLMFSFTILAILISCLGLFGLAAFAAESRTKEIGVRKVLGATTSNLVGLLSKEFLMLVLLALVVATPIAWYFMQGWLQDFHYHIDMPYWVFLLAGLVALAIAFFTVSFQSVKAALANPVESLRSE
ncbi:MAG: ABC transporter permease [Bacteroidota bacterium]